MADGFEVVCGECGRATVVSISDELREEVVDVARRAAIAVLPGAIKSAEERKRIKKVIDRSRRKC